MTNMHFHSTILTLYPEMFPGPLAASLCGKALEGGLWGLDTVAIRDFGHGRHAAVDDTPYGGGAGMVMRADVLDKSIEYAMSRAASAMAEEPQLLYMSPRGTPLTQRAVKTLALKKNLVILCGRFEGVDQRVLDHHKVQEVSVGDYILSGGEMAAMVLLDACIRLVPGVMGAAASEQEESFALDGAFQGLLEYPHYTRPALWNGHSVPDVLRSGDHGAIEAWRLQEAQKATRERRPALWMRYLARLQAWKGRNEHEYT